MKKLTLWILCAAAAVMTSCSLLQAVALKDCTYAYKEVTDVSFLGYKGKDILSFSGAAAVTKALLGKTETAPLNFTVHIGVTNPNRTTAALERLHYKVALDSVEIANGQTESSLVVISGHTADLPLKLSVDMKNALQGEKRQILVKALKNFIGMTSEPTNVTVQLKPIFRMGSGVVASPAYIPVKFSYPEKK